MSNMTHSPMAVDEDSDYPSSESDFSSSLHNNRAMSAPVPSYPPLPGMDFNDGSIGQPSVTDHQQIFFPEVPVPRRPLTPQISSAYTSQSDKNGETAPFQAMEQTLTYDFLRLQQANLANRRSHALANNIILFVLEHRFKPYGISTNLEKVTGLQFFDSANNWRLYPIWTELFQLESYYLQIAPWQVQMAYRSPVGSIIDFYPDEFPTGIIDNTTALGKRKVAEVDGESNAADSRSSKRRIVRDLPHQNPSTRGIPHPEQAASVYPLQQAASNQGSISSSSRPMIAPIPASSIRRARPQPAQAQGQALQAAVHVQPQMPNLGPTAPRPPVAVPNPAQIVQLVAAPVGNLPPTNLAAPPVAIPVHHQPEVRINDKGLELFPWNQTRRDMWRLQAGNSTRRIPPEANRQTFNPIDHFCPPACVNLNLGGSVNITILELLTYFPRHTAWREVMWRLRRAGWNCRRIVEFVMWVRDLLDQKAMKRATLERQALACRAWEENNDVAAGNDMHSISLQSNLSGVSRTLIDYTLHAMGDGVFVIPTNQDRGLLTEAVEYARLIGDTTTRLSQIEDFIQRHGLVYNGSIRLQNLVAEDEAALARCEAQMLQYFSRVCPNGHT